MEKFIIGNMSKTDICFTVYTPVAVDIPMSKHKLRKLRNSGNFFIRLKPNHSVDLIEMTGLSIKELMDNIEVRELVRVKSDKVWSEVQITEDIEVDEEKPLPEIDPIEEEDKLDEADLEKEIEDAPAPEMDPVEEEDKLQAESDLEKEIDEPPVTPPLPGIEANLPPVPPPVVEKPKPKKRGRKKKQ